MTAMPYTHRPTWPDESDDYVIRCEDLDVGRVYLLRGDRWLWTIFMNGHVPKVEGVPINGLAVTLDQAATDFKRSYELMREKAGLPKPASQRPETTIIGPRPVDRVPQRPSSPEANAPAPAPPQPVKPKETKRWIDGVPVIIAVPAALSVTIMILVLAVSLLYFVPMASLITFILVCASPCPAFRSYLVWSCFGGCDAISDTLSLSEWSSGLPSTSSYSPSTLSLAGHR